MILPGLELFCGIDEKVGSKTFVVFCRDEVVESDEAGIEDLSFGVLKPSKENLENRNIIAL